MELETPDEETLGTYFKEWWREQPAARKKRCWAAVGIFSAFWLVGALAAPALVPGLARVAIWLRLPLALGMGGFSFLWRGLTNAGVIQETVQRPSWLWFPLSLVVPGTLLLIWYLLSQPPHPRYRMRRLLERQRRAQGRVTAGEMAEKSAFQQGVPLVQVKKGKETKLIGLDYEQSEGHVMVIAPTRAGKGLHLTDTLRHYPGAALVIDPKSEQFERTAGLRSELGPVYRIPGHQVHLSAYYGYLRDQDQAFELHGHFLRPEDSREPIFAEKSVALVQAIGQYAEAVQRNPLRLLLDLAESNLMEALMALRAVPAARRYVDIFTNGAPPEAYLEDKFVTSAWGNFTTRLAPYQKHVDTIAPPDFNRQDLIIPPDWAAQNGTIYVTYDLNDLRAVSGVVAAIISALVRYQMRPYLWPQGSSHRQTKLLVAIDELPAVGLRNVADFLATGGSYGLTLLLYAQSVAQLQARYGREVTRAILTNCDHQLWYPAVELETARLMSELYGTALQANPMQSRHHGARQQQDREGRAVQQTTHNEGAAWSWQERAALSPNEMMALPDGQVLVTTRLADLRPVKGQSLTGQRYVFLGQRLDSIHLFPRLPPPDGLHLPRPVYGPRQYMDWKATAVQRPELALAQAGVEAEPDPPVEARTEEPEEEKAEADSRRKRRKTKGRPENRRPGSRRSLS